MTGLVAKHGDGLPGTVKFRTARRTISDVPIGQFLWMILFDRIHHRGQLSIYLRMAGGRVPSIYGPTAAQRLAGIVQK